MEEPLWKEIPILRAPLRYWKTFLAASMCPLDGSEIYLARKLVMVAISGRVEMGSQFIEFMRNYTSLVYLNWRFAS